jgi:UV DNA damage endonuclease
MRFTQFEKHSRQEALEILGNRALENLQTTLDTMKFARSNNWGYRISSTLFPLFNLDKANVGLADLPNATLIQDKFTEIKTFTKQFAPTQFRLSFHPDHFNVLCSANSNVVDRSINELAHHGWLMDEMVDNSRSYWYPLNVHMSRSSGDPQTIAREFIKNYDRLDDSVKSRLVLENEDKGVWSPDRLYNLIHKEIGIPITYDNLHHRCNPGEWTTSEAFERCYETWHVHGCCPLFHFSEGGANDNPRAHVDFATSTPQAFREQFDTNVTTNQSVDWDIELKQKDYAINHLQEMEQKQLIAA